MNNYKLSPSDLTFLYEGCKRCYYLKVVRNIPQPSIPLPSIFTKIAALLKDHYEGKRTEELHPSLPPGTIKYGEQWVTSQPIQLPGHQDTCYIKGRFDIVIEFDDGSYGVLDFKTGNPNEKSSALYSRQLHAYAYALEHPTTGALSLSPVSKMGLLYLPPSKISQTETGWLSYDSEIHWTELAKDEAGFLGFMGEVMTLLEASKPPPLSPDCRWCCYTERCEGV